MTSLKKKISFLIVAFVTGFSLANGIDLSEMVYNFITQIPIFASFIGVIGLIYVLQQGKDLVVLVKKLSVLSYFLAFSAGFELLKNPGSFFPLALCALFLAAIDE